MNVTRNAFYQNLGKLFYAVAMADNVVRPAEIQKLNEIVNQHWLEVDDAEDEYGTDAAYQISIVFDWLTEEAPEDMDYLGEFTEYYREHKAKFTPKIKNLIYATANAIAASFAGKNKAERIVLAKIKLLLG